MVERVSPPLVERDVDPRRQLWEAPIHMAQRSGSTAGSRALAPAALLPAEICFHTRPLTPVFLPSALTADAAIILRVPVGLPAALVTRSRRPEDVRNEDLETPRRPHLGTYYLILSRVATRVLPHLVAHADIACSSRSVESVQGW